MKGIVLAGGSGTRLYPMTLVANKQLLPVYDKPMVYYPLSVLMLAGIREVLVISTPEDLPGFRQLLGDGSRFGMALSYGEQPRPEGLAQALLIGEAFIGGEPVALVLGDNLFHGNGLTALLEEAVRRAEAGEATLFGCHVQDPERFGIVEIGPAGEVLSIEEKPEDPRSSWCVTGLYFYDGRAVDFAKGIGKSPRGELEITDVNRRYLEAGALGVSLLGRGFTWMDAGTPESLMEAAAFVQLMEKRQGMKVAALEEIAYRKGWIGREQLLEAADRWRGSGYGAYLRRVAEGKAGY